MREDDIFVKGQETVYGCRSRHADYAETFNENDNENEKIISLRATFSIPFLLTTPTYDWMMDDGECEKYFFWRFI